jgi:hypothetical protein
MTTISYCLIKDQQVIQTMLDLPQELAHLTSQELKQLGWYQYVALQPPEYDPKTHTLAPFSYNIEDTVVTGSWNIRMLNHEELQEHQLKAWELLKSQRDKKLHNTDWLILRHQDQLFLMIPTTLSNSQYQQLLQYRQLLRDLPTTTSDPFQVSWPVAPDFL